MLWPKTAAQTPMQAVYDLRPDKIDFYFGTKKMPLNGYGIWFVNCADHYGIDYNLLAAISVIESQGGKRYPRPTNNPFGWDSAKSGFVDINTAICFISEKLGTGKYYAGKSNKGKLQAYNPPSINPNYADNVLKIMNDINRIEVPTDYNLSTKQK